MTLDSENKNNIFTFVYVREQEPAANVSYSVWSQGLELTNFQGRPPWSMFDSLLKLINYLKP
jgi:hypothetical protein